MADDDDAALWRPLPPREAIAAFRAKGYRLDPSFSWKDKWQEDHAAAFTVAKAMTADVLQVLYDATERAMADGVPFSQFKKQLQPILAKAGWWGRSTMVDPKTGKRGAVQLGSPRRLKVIYDTNLRMAHAAGQWARIQRTAKARPYLFYHSIRSETTRPHHRAWHGTLLRVDHPWWNTHYPPCGWRCKCGVRQLSERDLKQRGLKVSADPKVKMRIWKNDRLGAEVPVPVGIDPGFGYNVGQATLNQNAARVFAEKSAAWTPRLAAAATAASGRALSSAQGEEFRKWLVAASQPQRRASGTGRVVGVLSMPVLDALAASGVQPSSGAIVVTDKNLHHMRRDFKGQRRIPEAMLHQLPELLAAPQAVLWDKKNSTLVYVLPIPDGKDKRLKIVVRPDVKGNIRPAPTQRKKTLAARVITAGIIRRLDLQDRRYSLLEGEM